MTRTERFAFWFDISQEFVTREPETAALYIEEQRKRFAAVRVMQGPRGGWYRLFTPPTKWAVREPDPFSWRPEMVGYRTTRMGRYVRPSRLRPEDRLQDVTFTSFEVPIRRGKALLPSGAIVETKAKHLVVPVI